MIIIIIIIMIIIISARVCSIDTRISPVHDAITVICHMCWSLVNRWRCLSNHLYVVWSKYTGSRHRIDWLIIFVFRLFIVATGCPSERRPQKTVSCYGGSARIQEETTENSAWFFNVLGV